MIQHHNFSVHHTYRLPLPITIGYRLVYLGFEWLTMIRKDTRDREPLWNRPRAFYPPSFGYDWRPGHHHVPCSAWQMLSLHLLHFYPELKGSSRQDIFNNRSHPFTQGIEESLFRLVDTLRSNHPLGLMPIRLIYPSPLYDYYYSTLFRLLQWF